MASLSESAVSRVVGTEISLSASPSFLTETKGKIIAVKWEIYCLAPESDCGSVQAECGIAIQFGTFYK